jgi:hypothetical protein
MFDQIYSGRLLFTGLIGEVSKSGSSLESGGSTYDDDEYENR